MFDEMNDKKKPAGLKAKMDVVKALREMAMEMMAEDAEEGEAPEGVMAKVEMSKMSDEPEGLDALEVENEGEEVMESPELEESDEGEMSDEELEELLAQKLQMLE